VTFIDNNEWKLPFNFAAGLHIAVILGAIYMPQYFNKKPLYPDIYTVDLINIEAPALQNGPAVSKPVQPQQQVKPETKPEVLKKSAPILENQAEAAVEPVKPVSIQPLKRKIIKKNVEPEVVQQKKNLEKINKQHLEEVRRAEKLAEEAARIAAIEAVNQLKNMIRETNTTTKNTEDIPSQTTARASSSKNSTIENQYFASVFSTLHPHWQLPEYKLWDQDLVAVIVIKIAKDGTIVDQYFEKKSGDRLFDQFVLKTLHDGSPLPPIPAAMQKNTLELGLRFIPGSIQ
jgi:colicin import membrane protein